MNDRGLYAYDAADWIWKVALVDRLEDGHETAVRS
jgi:hypothetical protein